MSSLNVRSWQLTKMNSVAAKRVSERPGVYVITESTWLHSVPIGIKIWYVGKSKNLRRRFVEHLDDLRTHRPELAVAIQKSAKVEFWSKAVDLKEIDEEERRLIIDLNPLFNKIRYGEMK